MVIPKLMRMIDRIFPQYESIIFLLENGTDISIKNNYGKNAIDIYKETKYIDEPKDLQIKQHIEHLLELDSVSSRDNYAE